jgi:hypothetical protein
LRTGVPAPDTAGQHGEKEQRKRRDDQQPGQIEKILRPEGEPQNVEFAFGQVEQDALASVPCEPGQNEVGAKRDPDGRDAQGLEKTGNVALVNVLAFLVEIATVTVAGIDFLDRDLAGICHTSPAFRRVESGCKKLLAEKRRARSPGARPL